MAFDLLERSVTSGDSSDVKHPPSDISGRVDYDSVAAVYATRYQRNDYTGVEQALAAFVAPAHEDRQRVLEVGCGTGHWLYWLEERQVNVFGLDRSGGMLNVAQASLCARHLVLGRAEALPYRNGSFARIFCINALHHFDDPAAFLREARRALRAGGCLLTVGLDPHANQDRWWIYDYFPEALAADRRRYLPAHRIRELMEASGFHGCESRVVQHLPREMTVDEATRAGFLDRSSTSQLMVISAAAYEAGLQRIHTAGLAGGGAHVLRSDLRLYGTTGCTA